jgi:hypothetical protein
LSFDFGGRNFLARSNIEPKGIPIFVSFFIRYFFLLSLHCSLISDLFCLEFNIP